SFRVHPVAIFHIELVTVAVPLSHFVTAVDSFSEGAGNNFCRPCSQSHARPFVFYPALLFQERDHRIRSVPVELGAVGIFDSTYVSREFNRGHLHPETKTEIRGLVLARVTRGIDFSFRSAHAESTRNENAGHILQLVVDATCE